MQIQHRYANDNPTLHVQHLGREGGGVGVEIRLGDRGGGGIWRGGGMELGMVVKGVGVGLVALYQR